MGGTVAGQERISEAKNLARNIIEVHVLCTATMRQEM